MQNRSTIASFAGRMLGSRMLAAPRTPTMHLLPACLMALSKVRQRHRGCVRVNLWVKLQQRCQPITPNHHPVQKTRTHFLSWLCITRTERYNRQSSSCTMTGFHQRISWCSMPPRTLLASNRTNLLWLAQSRLFSEAEALMPLSSLCGSQRVPRIFLFFAPSHERPVDASPSTISHGMRNENHS